jgi:hypothetical protein
MSPNSPSPMIATLLILGGGVFGVLGALHAIYTLLDLRNPRRLVPVDPSVAHAMANSALRIRLSDCRVGARTCGELGLGLTLATVLVCCWLQGWRSGLGSESKCSQSASSCQTLTVIGCIYLVLALLYWFRAPAIGVAYGTSCFAAAWVLSLS